MTHIALTAWADIFKPSIYYYRSALSKVPQHPEWWQLESSGIPLPLPHDQVPAAPTEAGISTPASHPAISTQGPQLQPADTLLENSCDHVLPES